MNLSRSCLQAFVSATLLVSVAHAQQAVEPSHDPQKAAVPLTPEMALRESMKKQLASLEKQRQAIHRQLADQPETAEVVPPAPAKERFIQPLITFNQPDCPPLDPTRVSELVAAAAQKQSLSPSLVRAVMKQESGFKPCAVSPKGALGLMQLMPSTARDLHVTNAFDPIQNVHAGAAYLRQMLDRYKGDLQLALVGYNAGPGRADLGPSAPYPSETQNYIEAIFADLGMETSQVQEDLAPAGDENSESTVKATDEKQTAPPEP